MGKSNKIKKAIVEESGDPYKTGTVLFSSGDTKHADVWDDSDLIDHWDRTVEVYRAQYLKQTQAEDSAPPFQQSKRRIQEGYIHKKKPVLQKRQINANQNNSTSQPAHEAPNLPQAYIEEDQLPENSQQPNPEMPSPHNMNGQPSIPSMPFMPPMPSVPSSNSQEELSNLMMAWYYCGYYTGLYQAQRKEPQQFEISHLKKRTCRSHDNALCKK